MFGIVLFLCINSIVVVYAQNNENAKQAAHQYEAEHYAAVLDSKGNGYRCKEQNVDADVSTRDSMEANQYRQLLVVIQVYNKGHYKLYKEAKAEQVIETYTLVEKAEDKCTEQLY